MRGSNSRDTRLRASPRRWVARTAALGLAVGLVVAFETATGGLLFPAVRRHLALYGALAVGAAHVYIGVASIPVLLAKIWSAATGYMARRQAARRLPAAPPVSGALVALYVALYGTGLALVTGITPVAGANRYIQAHTWLAVAAVVPTSLHLRRYLPLAFRALRAARRARGPQPLVVSRRLALGTLASGVVLAGGLALPRLASAALQTSHDGLAGRRAPASPKTSAAPTPRAGPAGVPTGPGKPDSPGNGFRVNTPFEGDAAIDLASWRLRVTGAVAHPSEFSYADLLALPNQTARVALECYLNFTADVEWTGVPLSALLAHVGARPDARLVRCVAGTAVERFFPEEIASRNVLLACRANGDVLSLDHGFPWRLVVPGAAGERWLKWIDEIDVVA